MPRSSFTFLLNVVLELSLAIQTWSHQRFLENSNEYRVHYVIILLFDDFGAVSLKQSMPDIN